MNNQDHTTITRRAAFGLAATAGGALSASSSETAGHESPGSSKSSAPKRRFEGKTVIVTGATSGIGRAAVIAFAAEGGKVGFCGRRENLGHELEQQIRSQGGEAIFIRADVRSENDVRSFVDRVADRYGRLDVALNNAGITIEKPLHDYSSSEWDDVMNTNLRGVFLAMKYEIPHMLLNGGGNIVVTSSSNALATKEKRSAYSASKRGLVGLVQSATFDYAQKGIRINALIPGTTDTALIRRAAGMEHVPDTVWEIGLAQWAKSNVPGLQRVAKPEEVAAFALLLASDEHPYMTGAQMVLDGGKTAHGG